MILLFHHIIYIICTLILKPANSNKIHQSKICYGRLGQPVGCRVGPVGFPRWMSWRELREEKSHSCFSSLVVRTCVWIRTPAPQDLNFPKLFLEHISYRNGFPKILTRWPIFDIPSSDFQNYHSHFPV